jgi:hypothetical protein
MGWGAALHCTGMTLHPCISPSDEKGYPLQKTRGRGGGGQAGEQFFLKQIAAPIGRTVDRRAALENIVFRECLEIC